jgi:hypothetical protein
MNSGYISDRRCPTNPEHGDVLGIDGVGLYCPHHGHDMPEATKNIWREDEFVAAKSLSSGTEAPVLIRPKIEKRNVRPANRRPRKTKRA